MSKRTAAVALVIMMLISMLFAGCVPSDLAFAVDKPTPEVTAETTATPSVTPSPTVTLEEARFSQDIQDFINETGEYTEESMNNRLLSYHEKVLDMGWVRGNGNVISLQGWFINYIRVGDYLVIASGFKGNDGKNHVKPTVIPISYFENGNQSTNFSFEEMGDWSLITSHHSAWESCSDNITDRLDVVRNNPVIFTFYNDMTSGTIGEAVKMFGEGCGPYFNELNNTDDLTNNLVSEVSVSNNEEILSRKADYNSNVGGSVPDIQSVDDLKNIDISSAPRIFSMGSNLW